MTDISSNTTAAWRGSSSGDDQVNDAVGGLVPSNNTNSSERSSASSGALLANVSVAPKEQTSKTGDTCTWYTNAQCYTPRTCYDCINVALRRDECAVDPSGTCVSMATFSNYASVHNKASALGINGFFPSARFTYCSVSDTTCNSCKAKWIKQYWSSGQEPSPAICRGAGGCICLSSCEMPNRVESIVSNHCSQMGLDSPKLPTITYTGGTVIALMILLGIWFVVYTKKRAKQERAREEQERVERRERRRQLLQDRPMRMGPPLALSAWNSLRDKLLESEREFLEGGKPALAELRGQTDGAGEHTVEGDAGD